MTKDERLLKKDEKIRKKAVKNIEKLGENYREEKVARIIKISEQRYNNVYATIGIFFPALLTFLPLIIPSTCSDETKQGVYEICLKVYPIVIFIIFLVLSLVYGKIKEKWVMMKKIFNDGENRGKDEIICELKTSNMQLQKEKVQLENDKRALIYSNSLMSLVNERLVQGTDAKGLCQVIEADIRSKFDNKGSFSTSIYSIDNEQIELIYYASCGCEYNNPELYAKGKPVPFTKKRKKFYSYRCISALSDGKKVNSLNRDQIRTEFTAPGKDYNQYGNCVIHLGQNRVVLIEVISYHDFMFAECEELQEFFEDLFENYWGLLKTIFRLSSSNITEC